MISESLLPIDAVIEAPRLAAIETTSDEVVWALLCYGGNFGLYPVYDTSGRRYIYRHGHSQVC